MNAMGMSLLWSTLQVGIFCLAGTFAYSIAGRGNRTNQAPFLCAVLITAAAISATSFSPWPRWWSLRESPTGWPVSARPTRIDDSARDQPPLIALSNAHGAPAKFAPAQATLSLTGLLSAFFADVDDQLSDEPYGNSNDPQWHWPAWLAVGVLAGAIVGAARLLLGWLSLVQLLRSTRQGFAPN